MSHYAPGQARARVAVAYGHFPLETMLQDWPLRGGACMRAWCPPRYAWHKWQRVLRSYKCVAANSEVTARAIKGRWGTNAHVM